jgi:hypothetical protein
VLQVCQKLEILSSTFANFHHASEAKLKECVFVCPDTRKLKFPNYFLIMITEFEKEAWTALKCVVSTFLGEQQAT